MKNKLMPLSAALCCSMILVRPASASETAFAAEVERGYQIVLVKNKKKFGMPPPPSTAFGKKAGGAETMDCSSDFSGEKECSDSKGNRYRAQPNIHGGLDWKDGSGNRVSCRPNFHDGQNCSNNRGQEFTSKGTLSGHQEWTGPDGSSADCIPDKSDQWCATKAAPKKAQETTGGGSSSGSGGDRKSRESSSGDGGYWDPNSAMPSASERASPYCNTVSRYCTKDPQTNAVGCEYRSVCE
jgi:hypothetical protein